MSPAPLIRATKALRDSMADLTFRDPVTHVYNPLKYAWTSHHTYLRRFGHAPKRVVFLGMNPGPFGMAQTGIPFGDVETVGGWLAIEVDADSPRLEHPKRPILGLDCPRVEVSGRRLWGWIRQRWSTPEAFFGECFVANYCPLVFLEAGGRNRTPDRLPQNERVPLFDRCDRALSALVDLLEPEWIVGIGVFAERRARAALSGDGIRIGRILHPSPASPAANRGWSTVAEAQLMEQGVFESPSASREDQTW